MADQIVPRYQQINVSDFVNFFLKSGLFIMEGERCALCNWWSDVVMAVLICHLFAIIHNSIRGARWLSGRVSDSGARGRGFETYYRRVVSLSKTLYSPKVLVNYPGSGGSVPT